MTRGLIYGAVIVAWLPSEHGDDFKARRAVVITGDSLLRTGSKLAVAVCTTKLDPADPRKINVPHAEDGRCGTGLIAPSCVNCGWVCSIDKEDILEVIGIMPTNYLTRILPKVREYWRQRQQPPS